MVLEPLVLQEVDVVTEAADDAPNLLMLCVLFLLTCIAAGNYGNAVSSIIVMVLVVELTYCDQRIPLLLKSVNTVEYSHQMFFIAKNSGGSDKNSRGSTRKQPIFFTYTYLSN